MLKKIIKKFTPKFILFIYHYFLAFLGALFFGFPSRKMTVIGVTGTSGKSTTVNFITKILKEAHSADSGQTGHKTASMSTIKFTINDIEKINSLKMTMPGRFAIQKFLYQAKKQGCKYVVLEVSSEGVRQFRHKFINFKTAVFTNLSPEHIESHGGFENYRNEKVKFFKAVKNTHIINADDKNAEYFLKTKAKKIFKFSLLDRTADIFAENIETSKSGINFKIQNIEFNISLLGAFNVYNALSAISVALSEGISLEICKKALEKINLMPGRMEIVSIPPEAGSRYGGKNPTVIVDYAHTPEQLENVYKTLFGNSKFGVRSSNLICVLGSCGGGRDKWKRPVLGQIASKYCSQIILTNEDPYDERPEQILQEIKSGISEDKLQTTKEILDRKQAIHRAIELAKPEDIVIITGKGSENLMCLENGKKIPWSDKEIVKSFPY